jgi:hypothetical protein
MHVRSLIVATLLIVLSGGVVAAQAEESSKMGRRAARTIARCDEIEARITQRIATMGERKGAHTEQYAKLQTKVGELITKAKAAGYDTTALEADLVVLKAKVTTFTAARDAEVAALEATQTSSCGGSEGEFKQKLTSSRTELKAVRAAVKDIHDYLKDTVRPAVLALRKSTSSQ